MIRTLGINEGKGTMLISGVSGSIHGNIFQQVHVNQRKTLPTTRTHPSRSHEVGSQKFPTLVPNVQHELLNHGEDKNVIDGLNNKLIKIFQEDGLICCMNKAKVLVRPKA
jgi:hypothetical protein